MEKVEAILDLLREFEDLNSEFARSERGLVAIINTIQATNPSLESDWLFDTACPASSTRDDVAALNITAGLPQDVLLDLTKAVYNARFYRNAAKDAESAFLSATMQQTRSKSRAIRVWADLVAGAYNEVQETAGKHVILQMLSN